MEFKNEKMIKEWIVNLENHVTLLKANLICEKRQCSIMEKTTDGFVYKDDAKQAIQSIKDSAEMISQYLFKP